MCVHVRLCRGMDDSPAKCPSNTQAFVFEQFFTQGRYYFFAVGKNSPSDTVSFQLSLQPYQA